MTDSEILAATNTALAAAMEAELLLSAGTVKSYSLDTGQTKQDVTKKDLGSIKNMISTLLNRRDIYSARVNGTGAALLTPYN